MNLQKRDGILLGALSIAILSSSAHAQNPCQNIREGATPQETAGCIPLTYKPADGGPIRTVWAPATFVGPVQGSATASAAARKRAELDFGVTAHYVDPDFGRGANVDVGAFIAFTGKYFGAEIDAADTVRSGSGTHESYFAGGPRVQYRARHYTVFAKAQVGLGHFSLSQGGQALNNKQNFLVESYGGGLEFKVSRHIKVRAIDANYQIWPTFNPSNLTPFHVGSGIAFSL